MAQKDAKSVAISWRFAQGTVDGGRRRLDCSPRPCQAVASARPGRPRHLARSSQRLALREAMPEKAAKGRAKSQGPVNRSWIYIVTYGVNDGL